MARGNVLLVALSLVFLTSPVWRSPRLFGRGSKHLKAAFFTAEGDSLLHPLPGSPQAALFWQNLQDFLGSSQPSFAPLQRLRPTDWPWIAFDRATRSTSPRFENYELDDDQIDELSELRQDSIEKALEWSRDISFVPGSRGIVSTSPPNAFGIQTTQLWMIREVGSILPVEIWIWDREDWEDKVCNDVFPSLGAKCMVMADYYPQEIPNPFKNAKINETFAFKSLALLFSTFEQALFLDNDCFPVTNPDSLFTTEPFTWTGFVLWPDVWAVTTSKYWYQITQKPMPAIWDRASTEAGQILINKATHGALLILAHAYIYHGQQYWQRIEIMSAPGAMGHGDKEVWLAAAHDLELPWYQVNERPQRVGYRCHSEQVPVGTAHSHPLDDYRFLKHGIVRHDGGSDFGEAPHPRILFIHHNMPKPGALYLLNSAFDGSPWVELFQCLNKDGSREVHRLWGPEELTLVKFGWDPEKAFWRGILWAACVHGRDYDTWTKVSLFRPKSTLRSDMCEKLTEHWNALFPGEVWSPRLPKFGAHKEHQWGNIPVGGR